MNWQPFENWWAAQGLTIRRALAALLALVCAGCAFLFLSCDLQTEHSAALDRTGFTMGKPDAWLVWRKTVRHSPENAGFTREHGLRVFTLSFGAGALAYGCAVMLVRIARLRRRA